MILPIALTFKLIIFAKCLSEPHGVTRYDLECLSPPVVTLSAVILVGTVHGDEKLSGR
jgi:hypothetical protein